MEIDEQDEDPATEWFFALRDVAKRAVEGLVGELVGHWCHVPPDDLRLDEDGARLVARDSAGQRLGRIDRDLGTRVRRAAARQSVAAMLELVTARATRYAGARSRAGSSTGGLGEPANASTK